MVSLLLFAATLGPLREDPALSSFVVDCVKQTVGEMVGSTGIKADELAAVLVEVTPGGTTLKMGQYRGDAPFYPASVVKLFYLAYAHERMRQGAVKATPEVQRCLTDMIVDSSNEATQAVVDLITDTTGGPELEPKALEAWSTKRNAVNRWFAERGYAGINVNQKTYGEGPYGRERQFLGANYENRNSLSALATARLMAEIVGGQIQSPERCAEMRKLLSRKVLADAPDADSQSKDFVGAVLPSGSKLWSKAGWTSTVRHDVAYVELPDGRKRIVCIYTKAHSGTPTIIRDLAKRLLQL